MQKRMEDDEGSIPRPKRLDFLCGPYGPQERIKIDKDTDNVGFKSGENREGTYVKCRPGHRAGFANRDSETASPHSG